MSPMSFPRRRAAALAAAACLSAALAGCQTGPDSPVASYPVDVRDRHPIVLANAPRVLDVFVDDRRGFSDRERRDLAAFLSEYRQKGLGPLTVQVPAGSDGVPGARATLGRIREAAGGQVRMSSYRPADPSVASAFRLTFRSLQAKVGTECGQWPQDLGVGDYEFSEANQPYYNFGCAVRSGFAAQVADPVDLVRGRQMTPPDTVRRMGNIDKLRQGTDPSTTYKTESMSVKSGVGQ